MESKPQKKPRGKAKKTKSEEIEIDPENVIIDDIPSKIPAAESNEEEPELKEEVKPESKEEVKEDPKEEPELKEEVKPESKEEVKEDPKEEPILETIKKVEELESVIDEFIKLVDSEEPVITKCDSKPEVKYEFENIFEMKSLLNLMIIISVRPEMQKKYELNSEMIQIISLMLQNHASLFTVIEDSFKKIVADNKIDANDVPELMSLFSNMYEVLCALKLKKKTVELSNACGNIIKLVFNIMLTEHLILFEGESVKNTTECFNGLVDSSTSLIKLSKTVKLRGKCCFW